MRKAPRGLIAGSVLGVSALATLAQVGVAAAAPDHHALATKDAGSSTPQARPDGGCVNGESSSPDYGCGKVTVEAAPVAGTYPTGVTPDLAGLTFDIDGAIADNDVPYQDAKNTCTTVADTTDTNATCRESVWGEGTDPATSSAVQGTWIAGDAYTVSLDTTSPSQTAPADTLIPSTDGTFLDCTAEQNPSGTSSGCPDTVTVNAYGTYHHLGVVVTNSTTKKAVANASYALCSPTAAAPVTGTSSCPTGSTVVTTATSNSKGLLVFPSVYPGSANYSVVPTKEPAGYQAAKSLALNVPVVTVAAQSGTLVAASAKLAPVKTTVVTHTVHTKKNHKVKINAFAHAKHLVKPLTLTKIGKVKHGTVHHTGGEITFKPKHGFVGTVTFTYTVRNAVGATSTGKIVIHVKH